MNNFERINREIEKIKKTTSWFNIGKTRFNKNIVCFVLKSNINLKKTILVQCGVHAREFITSYLAIELIKFLKNFNLDCNIYFVPLSNPDGLDICQNGAKNIYNKIIKYKIQSILKKVSKRFYKSNAMAVDINTNFDALWGKGKYNERIPNYQNFIGYQANSENETKALISLVDLIKPNITISYHSKGNVIYYGFDSQSKKEELIQKELVKILKKETKYKPILTKNSTGGFKDYCIYKKNIIGFTIEVGDDKLSHPIEKKYLAKIFDKNKFALLKLIKGLEKENGKNNLHENCFKGSV